MASATEPSSLQYNSADLAFIRGAQALRNGLKALIVSRCQRRLPQGEPREPERRPIFDYAHGELLRLAPAARQKQQLGELVTNGYRHNRSVGVGEPFVRFPADKLGSKASFGLAVPTQGSQHLRLQT